MKRKLNALLKILIAILLLTSIIVTTLFGTSTAEFFKSFSQKLDVELIPDLRLKYYLKDSKATNGTNSGSDSAYFNMRYGYYDTAEGFSQTIIIGKSTAKKIDGTNVTHSNGTNYDGKTNLYCGQLISYAMSIPVDEPGYYNLNFTCSFVTATSATTAS